MDQGGAKFCELKEGIFTTYSETVWPFLNLICGIVGCSAARAKEGDIESSDFALGVGTVGAWCKYFNEDTWLGGEGYLGEVGTPLNVKESIIWSTFCLCLPGIIYNLEKLRQIRCFEVVCLYDYVRGQDITTDICDEMTSYLTCAYVIGEIFALLPWLEFFEKITDLVVKTFSDPITFIGAVFGVTCYVTCPAPDAGVSFNICAIGKLLAIVGDAWLSIEQVAENDFFTGDVNNRYCGRMEDIDEERKENQA